MRHIFRTFAVACGVAGMMAIVSTGSAFAQAKQPAPKQAAPAPQQAAPPQQDDQFQQMALTEKQIQNVLAAAKDIDAIASKIPENQQPSQAVMNQLNNTAKKYGFASFDDYSAVTDNISLVLAGVDPNTKKYVGPEAVIKAQIAEVQADKTMSAADKKQALEELNAALKTPAPKVENQGNIPLVIKYFDKLSEVLQ